MRAPRTRTILLAIAGLVLAPSARAAVDAFIWFEDGSIKGESRDPQHQGWIEVSSFQIDQLRNAAIGSATGGAGAGKVAVHDISITKHVDASSPKLHEASRVGKRFPKVTISMRKAGGDPGFMNVTLHDVLVSSYQMSSGGDRPTESLSLNFTKVEYKNIPQTKSSPYGIQGAQAAPAGGAAHVGTVSTPTPAGRK